LEPNTVDKLANVLQDKGRSGELQNAIDLLHHSARGVDSSSSENNPRGTEQHERMSELSPSYANPRSHDTS